MGNKQSKPQRTKMINHCLSQTNRTLLPSFAERKIYENLFSILLDYMENSLEESTITLFGHTFVPYSSINNDANLPEVKLSKRRRRAINILADKMVDNGYSYVPDELERSLYKNVIIIVTIVFEMFLRSCTFTCSGYTITLSVQPKVDTLLQNANREINDEAVITYLRDIYPKYKTWWIPDACEWSIYYTALRHCSMFILTMFDDCKVSYLHKTVQYQNM